MTPASVKRGKNELKNYTYEDQKNLSDKELIDKTLTKNQMARFIETTKDNPKPKIEIESIVAKYSNDLYKTQSQTEQNTIFQKNIWKGKRIWEKFMKRWAKILKLEIKKFSVQKTRNPMENNGISANGDLIDFRKELRVMKIMN